MSVTNHNNPVQMQAEMADLELALMEMMNAWSDAAERHLRASREIERLKAPRRLQLKRDPSSDPNLAVPKPTREDLDAAILTWLWAEHGALMEAELNAEALCIAFETKHKVARQALSSKQSRLKADLALGGGVR